MTEAVFTTDNGKITAFAVSGHSGYGHEGDDIVCASVSSVVWMTVNGLENVLGAKPKYVQNGAEVRCSIPDDAPLAAQALLESLRQFLCNLSIEYEKYLTVKEVPKNV